MKIGYIILALTLAACGLKGPLERPVSEPEQTEQRAGY